MRNFWPHTLAAASLALAPAVLLAQEPGELFEKLDANKDGFVTPDEVPDDKQTIFERLIRAGDANSDKKLSKEEFATGLKQAAPQAEPAAEGRRPGGAPGAFPNVSPKEIFARMDRDGNGKIEKDEIPERMKENLGRVDSNSDGAVDLAEFEKVAQFFQGRRPEGAPGNPPEGRPGQGGPGPFSPVVRAIDADGDGEISASEMADAAKALAKLDKNGDGKLTRDEIGPPLGAGPQGRPGEGGRPGAGAFAEQFLKRLQAADTNGDKKLSKDEAPDRIKENFDRLDTNSDGQLDEAELKAMFQRLQNAGGDRTRRPDGEPKRE